MSIHTKYIFICLLLLSQNLNSQIYLGAGNDSNITVSSSSDSNGYTAENTINGSGMDADLMEAARFLSQSTFGSRMSEVEYVAEIGFENWINEQVNMPIYFLTEDMWSNWDRIVDGYDQYFVNELANLIYFRQESASAINTDSIAPPLSQEEVDEERAYYLDNIFGPSALHFNNVWWHNMVTKEDQLRQRVAYALSQIFVVSSQSDLSDHAEILTYYYDILLGNAFGNFRDMLEEITLSPAMGHYLSHLNNPKAVPEENLHPDENYAREIMQLFTIGLYELNLNGTRKVDANGNEIPTYTNADIKELARVFTGLGPGALDQRMYEAGDITWTDVPYFGLGLYSMSKEDPMVMYEEWHDQGSKSLLNGLEIPAGQSGMEDIDMALDYLFNHPNVGPFIARRMIQRLVRSNPSPDYIERVSLVFNNDGNGTRGNMAAVVKAILLDPEARSCESMMAFENGKLSEPMIRHCFITRMAELIPYIYFETYNITSYDTAGLEYVEYYEYVDPEETIVDYWNNGYADSEIYKQYVLRAPTVFNFYLPDHQAVGEITQNDLYSPEFKIHDTSTSINYLNSIWNYVGNPWWNNLWWNWYGLQTQIEPQYERYAEIYQDGLENLIHHLDIEFCYGKMSDDLRATLRSYDEDVPGWVDDEMVARFMIYLVMISPDYTIEK